MMEREELLSSVSSDISHYRGKEQGRNQKMDSLQRELEHTRSARSVLILPKHIIKALYFIFRNSERLIDEQINIALETRDNLVNQREIIKVCSIHVLLVIKINGYL